MAYEKEANGFVSVPAPEFGAIFMSNIATKRDCFKHKVFGLPSSMANFVKEVKKGMMLFLFEFERRQLFGVYRATSNGEMNIVPHAYRSSGKQFSAQVRFTQVWNCRPLSENEFYDAIRENYFSARKFHFGLSDEQVHRLLRLFSSKKVKTKLPPRMLAAGVSNRDDGDHNVDLEPSLSKGYPRSFRGVRRDNDDMFLVEHTVESADKINSAERGYYSDKKRRICYDGRLLGDNAAEDNIRVHFLTEKLGFSGDEWSSLNDRVKCVHKMNTNYTPVVSSYMEDSDLRRTADDENLTLRDQMVNENNMDINIGLGRSNENSPPLTEGQNLYPSCTNFHDASITRVMPYEHGFPSSCCGQISNSEVEQGSNSVCKPSSYNVHRGNNFATSKGISSPYSYPKFTKNGLESASEDGKKASLLSQDGLKSSLNVRISAAMEANRFGPFDYITALIPKPSTCRQVTGDEIHDGESWRFSSKGDLNSIASHLFSDNNQSADEEIGGKHVKWQRSDGTHIGRKSCSPKTCWLPHQGSVLTNLDHANSPGADIVDDEYEGKLHSDIRTSRGSVFSRLSLAPKSLLREQKADQNMIYDEYYMDTTVDEIMDMLYDEQKIVPKKLNRKSFVHKVGYGESNQSGKHAAVFKNNAEQLGDSMMTVENEVIEEPGNHVLTETRVVEFKRRRETNRASEETKAKVNKEEKSNSNELTVLNAQQNSSETAEAKDSADKPFKRRKLVRPAFDENNSMSDLNHQLPCKEAHVVSTEKLDYIPL